VRIIVIGAPDLAAALAAHLHLDHVSELADIARDAFVLDGTRLGRPEARALDAVLRSRGADVDALLWVKGGDPAVLEHYAGRVLELDSAEGMFEAALERLREVLLAA
jgi:hypothetical protein